MKKVLFLLFFLFLGLVAQAEIIEIESDITMKNLWERLGKAEEKVLVIGARVANANHLEKRIPIQVLRDAKIVNAFSYRYDKLVVVSTGILAYIDNDDELAYLLGHEMTHSLDSYGGPGRWLSMTMNSRQYEYKADLNGVDMMVKAGYNPIAAITLLNKIVPESPLDFGIRTSHPRTSKRLLAIYKYIYKKYPWALDSDMAKNIYYVNFTYSAEKEINDFKQSERVRLQNKGHKELL